MRSLDYIQYSMAVRCPISGSSYSKLGEARVCAGGVDGRGAVEADEERAEHARHAVDRAHVECVVHLEAVLEE